MWGGILTVILIWVFPPWEGLDSKRQTQELACFHFMFQTPGPEVATERTYLRHNVAKLKQQYEGETAYELIKRELETPQLSAWEEYYLLKKINDLESTDFAAHVKKIQALRKELRLTAITEGHVVRVDEIYKYDDYRLDWFCIGWLHGMVVLIVGGLLITFKTTNEQ